MKTLKKYVFPILLIIPLLINVILSLSLFFDTKISNIETYNASLICLYIVFSCLWMFITFLKLNKFEKELKNTLKFVFSIIIFVICFCILYFKMLEIESQDNFSYSVFILLFFLFIIYFICFFYSIIILAKKIKSLEIKKEATISQYYVEMILIAFLFIGIWYLIPQINKIIEEKYTVNLKGYL